MYPHSIDKSLQTITFKIIYPTEYGQVIHIIGSHKKFGNWNPKYSVPLQWNNGNIWTLTGTKQTLPKRSEYKFIWKHDNGEIEWEDRPNRAFDINIMNYTLRTSKGLEKNGYALLDQRTTKLEYYVSKNNAVLTHKWGI